jgi:two-component system sensor histidine kinase HupT/HoxJ
MTRRPALPAPPDHGGLDEATWLDVIHKMDEVYSQLLADEVQLEQKNAQLEQSQQFIFSLLSAMSDVLIACRADGTIEETNAALNQLVGRDEAALRGTPVTALLADEVQAAQLRQTCQTLLPRAEGADLEVDLLDAQGTRVPVDFHCTVRRNVLGKPIGHVLVGRPLGEIKRAYLALREAHEALKRAQAQLVHNEKMASLGRLVAGVAHELNNPISFVLGNVRALERYGQRLQHYLGALHGGLPAAQQQALRGELRIDALLADLPSLIDGMREGAQRTADIVAGLKRFSAVDRETRRPVVLAPVIERAMLWVQRGTAPGFRVTLAGDATAAVMGDPGPLMQVAMNLIQNAADATRGRPDAALAITIAADADRVRARFADNGPGIAEGDLPRIFDPFFTTKPVGQGTGLGLSISYGIAEQHGGTLSAANAPDGGAVFTLDLPRCD